VAVFSPPEKSALIERRRSVVKFAGLEMAFGHAPIVATHIYSARRCKDKYKSNSNVSRTTARTDSYVV
jgi:hypothetical protein